MTIERGRSNPKRASVLPLAATVLVFACTGNDTTLPPPPTVTTVAVSLSSSSVVQGETVTATATASDQNGQPVTGRPVVWTSAAPAVATITPNGVLTGVAPGQTQVLGVIDGKEGQATLTVTPIPVATVSVTPASAALAVDETQQLTATTLSGRGAVLTGRAVTWSSSDPSRVTVTATGQITGVAAGTAVVSATSEGKSGSATITVTFTPVLTSLSLTPPTPTVFVGLTTQITAIAQDQKGGNMAGATFTYQSSDQTRASVSNTGLVTGVAAGTSSITVTGTIASVTKSASVDVTVRATKLTASVTATTGNVFEPQVVLITRGGTVTWTFNALHNVVFTPYGRNFYSTPANIPNTSSGSVSRRFPAIGTYPYRCSIHPSMIGYVEVR
jgi:uncharacterized protein YjdB